MSAKNRIERYGGNEKEETVGDREANKETETRGQADKKVLTVRMVTDEQACEGCEAWGESVQD